MRYTINNGGLMKLKLFLITFLAVFVSNAAYSATCTSINYSSKSANSVLTSSAYNTDHSTAYNAINNFDGGCLATSSIDDQDSFDTTEFSVWRDTPIAGCTVTISDTNTLSVDKCRIMVNGNNLKTTSANTQTWGCSGCDSETASGYFYLYVKNSATFTLHIDNTAPSNDGYDASNNRVLARFWNDASSNITSVGKWDGSAFAPDSQVSVTTGNLHGAVGTKIRIFSGTPSIKGADITYATSANAGNSFTVNSDGVYSMHYIDYSTAGVVRLGISVNASSQTTNIQSLAIAEIAAIGETSSAGGEATLSATLFLKSGDIVRAHTAGGPDGTTNVKFVIKKIANAEVN